MEFGKFLAPALVLLGAACSLLSFPSSALAACPLITPPSAFFPSIPYVSSSPVTSPVSAELESIITSHILNSSIPFYAVSVVHEDQIVFTSGLSTCRFLIGSISKTFTALGALILRERGLLSLDDPVKKFLPNFTIINPYAPHDITLRELMGHAAGMPRELCANQFVAHQSEEQCPAEESDVLNAIAKMQLIEPPWSRQPAYSNLGFALLGHSWEKATSPSQSWQDFVMDEIITPLGLNNTGVDLTNVTLAGNESGAQYDIGWLGPAGTMYSTAVDLAKYLIFLLNASPAIVSAPTISEWTNSRTIFPDGNGGYALPWELLLVNSTGGEFLITKGGALAKYMSIIGIHPPTQLGVSVVLLLNQSSIGGPDALMEELFNVLIPFVETRNAEVIDAVYAGHYVCETTPPFFSQYYNVTLEALGGVVNVTGSPSLGLSASFNLTLVEAGLGSRQVLTTAAMLLKNATENSFWLGSTGSCLSYFDTISGGPSVTNPNFPGSVYVEEIMFDLINKTLKWPALGAVCAK